ncbi:nuclear speckle splicing regulatory protein 1 [Bactrocera neohumeralis]|uniref:nuclear speckle splicing regulatory protein 1 n=1 Tax=Bactrocera tryoni TaxID=59916 RepID=UPI001A9857EA|nr:nuclear speckle splicing regulatory protein 1 [Bactrocera tryoni]XP_050331052.1 nuclear speckle splicing regulatory protein 1 [Bactrocera neohumeralis]
MSKQYGLIIPGQQKKQDESSTAARPISKPSIFDESSSDDESRPQFKPRTSIVQGPSLMERRIARTMQEKALKEDPTVFQYDELYDEMENKREQEQEVKSKEPKKPKYIGRLMEFAERRKLENELRVERQVQKEREQEGEEFKDKESFVTSTYRKKLEEMRKLQEQEKRDEYLEAIGDVTKQKDLDGFYRHLFEQKTGSTKEVKKPDLLVVTSAGDEDDIAYKPIKSGKVPQQRTYRKRRASDEMEEDDGENAENESKKVHLSNNIDADSDFSIDSSSDDEETSKEAVGDKMVDKTKGLMANNSATTTAINLDAIKKEKPDEKIEENDSKTEKLAPIVSSESDLVDVKPKVKIDKSAIWKKRTVGEVYEAAVQRYYERRAARRA